MNCVRIPLKMHHPVSVLFEFVRHLVFSEKRLGSALGYNKHCLHAFATLLVWEYLCEGYISQQFVWHS